MTTALDEPGNTLLQALVRSSPGPWLGRMELVNLALGSVVHEAYKVRDDVFFPVTAIVSLLHVLTDGRMTEVAVVGNEGIVGTSVYTGDGVTPNRAVVQCGGSLIRLPAVVLKQAFLQRLEVAMLLLQFTQALIAQMSQNAVCNRHHSIEQQLCRWLLLMLDRHEGNEIVMTQELIANMLGVRRESVSTAAARLQKAGAITYLRGKITVLDRALLEGLACECYAVVRAEYARLRPSAASIPRLPATTPARDDALRLRFLQGSGLLGVSGVGTFQEITRQLAGLLEVPITIVSLLDEHRDCYVACTGYEAGESPVETSLCDLFFATSDSAVVIEDLALDPRFAAHPFVRSGPRLRFYAAVRLVIAGQTVGTLCACDRAPRQLDAAQLQAMTTMAAVTVAALEAAVGELESLRRP